jgi:AraC-like DNA-binding protein
MPSPIRSTMLFDGGATGATAARPRLMSLGLYESSERYEWPRHQHLTFEAILPTRGRYRCRLNGVEVDVAPRHALLVKPGDWHEDLLDRGSAYWALNFTLADAALRTVGGWFREGIAPARQVCSPPRGELEALLGRMRAESARGDAFAALLQDTMLAEFAWRLARAFPAEALAPALVGELPERGFAARLERAFAAHVHQRFAVPAMARALGMSRTALTDACRRQLGLAPAKAFARYRLDRAYALLTRTEMSVVEVSQHLGYENPFHFSRAFKRRWGRPPSGVAKHKA